MANPAALEGLPEAIGDFRNSGIVSGYLNQIREHVNRDTGWIPPDCEPGNMLLHRGAWDFRLLFGSKLPVTVVESNVEDRCVFSLSGKATVRNCVYAVHGVVDDQVFSPDATISPTGARIQRDYAYYFASDRLATVQEFSLELGEVYVELRRSSTQLLRWAFSRTTGKAAYLYCSRIKWSQAVLLLDYLKVSKHFSAVPAALPLLQHPFYLIRWKALQMVVALQAERFEPLITAACSDPHPLIAKAARALLPAIALKAG